MDYTLIKWLNDESKFESRYMTNNKISNIKQEIHDYSVFRKYYCENTTDVDIDILLSDDLVENVEIYTDDFKNSKQIKIAPGTNLKHANFLFKQLINASEDLILDKNTRKSIFSQDMKKDFYNLCRKYS